MKNRLAKLVLHRSFFSKFIFISRRFFHWFSFIMILQNTIVGIFSTVFRVIVAFIFGLLFFMRLDKILLMKGMEFFDFGKKIVSISGM